MKRIYLSVILLFLSFLCFGITVSQDIKPKCTLLIDDNNYWGGVNESDHHFLYVKVLIVNNSNDTLRYIGTDCLYSKLYYTSNKNMIVQDDKCDKGNTIGLTIPPHKILGTQLSFKFRKVPDTTFRFKIGMKLIKWDIKSKLKFVSYKTVDTAPVLWSQTWVLKTNRKHEIYGLTEKERNELELKKPLPIYYHLTNQDRKNYTLSIDQHKITKGYTLLRYEKNDEHTLLSIPLKFTNNSKDTLRYISMSCTWWDFYRVSIKGTEFWSNSDCTKNIPSKVIVPPHRSLITLVQIVYKKGAIATNTKFKIGLSLQKSISNEQTHDASAYLLRQETSNLIWSNEVKVP
jgi:hypothetical protein